MKLIMPMAGDGSRVQPANGQKVFKPLIVAKNKRLLEWAQGSLGPVPITEKIGVVRSDHLIEFDLESALKPWFDRLCIIDHQTRGPLETVVLACRQLDLEGPTIILDSDVHFSSPALNRFLADDGMAEVDGTLITFESDSKAFSYVKTQNGFAVDIAEKRVISGNALAGCYGFSNAKAIGDCQLDHLKTVQTEFYISDYIRQQIQYGRQFKVLPTSSHVPLGTAADLRNFTQK